MSAVISSGSQYYLLGGLNGCLFLYPFVKPLSQLCKCLWSPLPVITVRYDIIWMEAEQYRQTTAQALCGSSADRYTMVNVSFNWML